VVVQQDHPLAAHEAVSLQDLLDYEVYTYRADIPVGKMFDDFLRENGLTPFDMRLNRDSDDDMMIGGIVSQEPVVGVCLVTSSLLPYRNVKILPFQEPSAHDIYTIGVLKLADARLNPAALDFLSYLEQFPVERQMLPDDDGGRA
jgi:hypothetical protein